MQATLGFFHRRRSVVADFDFSHSGAALQRQHGYGRANQIQQLQRHAVALKDLDLDNRIRVSFDHAENSSMPIAARLPSATLSMIRRGPKTQSPPAKIPFAEVINVCGFTAISPRGDSSTPSSGLRKSRFGAWPTAMIMVSHSSCVSLPS